MSPPSEASSPPRPRPELAPPSPCFESPDRAPVDTDSFGEGSDATSVAGERTARFAQEPTEEAPVSMRCWELHNLERLCEDLCSLPPRRLAAQAVCRKWRSAVELDSNGCATEVEVQLMRRALNSVSCRSKSGRSARGGPGHNGFARDDGLPGRNMSAPTQSHRSARAARRCSLAVSAWLYALVRLSAAGPFFDAVEALVLSCGPGMLARLSVCFDRVAASVAPHLHASYRQLLTAVSVAADPSVPLDPAEVSASETNSTHPEWVERTLILLGESASGNLSCDAFACACLGRRVAPVQLNCYNLSGGAERFVGRVLLGLDGVWHSGLVAHGYEYWYGGRVHRCHSGQTPFGVPTMALPLGRTLWSQRELLAAIRDELLPRFSAEGYNLLSLNCNDFCDSLSTLLLGKHIPDNIGRQAERALKSVVVRWLQPWVGHWNSSHRSESCVDIGAMEIPSRFTSVDSMASMDEQIHSSSQPVAQAQSPQIVQPAGDCMEDCQLGDESTRLQSGNSDTSSRRPSSGASDSSSSRSGSRSGRPCDVGSASESDTASDTSDGDVAASCASP